MKAKVGHRTFEASSWPGVVVAVVEATGARALHAERREAAQQLAKGVSVVLTGGVVIKPEGARE